MGFWEAGQHVLSKRRWPVKHLSECVGRLCGESEQMELILSTTCLIHLLSISNTTVLLKLKILQYMGPIPRRPDTYLSSKYGKGLPRIGSIGGPVRSLSLALSDKEHSIKRPPTPVQNTRGYEQREHIHTAPKEPCPTLAGKCPHESKGILRWA